MFRESVRDRVLYNLVGFALLVIGASFLIGQLTAGQDVKIIKDLGLAAMSIFGLFIAIFIGIGLVSKEVERRSIYSLIAKPVRRSELVVGKYLGLVLTIAVNVAVMTAVWYVVLGYMSWMETEAFKQSWEAPATDPRMLVAVYLIVVQLMLVIAIALFFSTFAEPDVGGGVHASALYVAGHFSADLKHFDVVVGDSPLRYRHDRRCTTCCRTWRCSTSRTPSCTPSRCRRLRWRRRRAYGACYIVALVAAAVWIFSRRDFK